MSHAHRLIVLLLALEDAVRARLTAD